jgi:uncharacterized membrane protein YraQ (UPF0718 family)
MANRGWWSYALASLAAGIVWVAAYLNLAALARWVTYSLAGLTPGTHLASAVEFFVFEAPKVLMLLVLVVFGVGIIRSFFTPERTRRVLAGRRESWRRCSAPSPPSAPAPRCRSSSGSLRQASPSASRSRSLSRRRW